MNAAVAKGSGKDEKGTTTLPSCSTKIAFIRGTILLTATFSARQNRPLVHRKAVSVAQIVTAMSVQSTTLVGGWDIWEQAGRYTIVLVGSSSPHVSLM